MILEIRYRVKVNQLAYDMSKCEGSLPKTFTSPELYIESNNPQIRSLAAELADDKPDPCEQVRAFYDYVGERLVYTYNGRDWGAQAALGEMGADCSEYADLMIALSRAAGIPARYLEGVLFLEPATDSAGAQRACLAGGLSAQYRLDSDGPNLGALTDTTGEILCRTQP